MKSTAPSLLLALLFPCLAGAADRIVLADFSTAIDVGAWQSKNINEFRVENGALRGMAKTNDPILLLDQLPIDEPIDVVNFKQVLITLHRPAKNFGSIKLFWKTDLSPTMSENTIVSDVSEMKGTIEVIFDVGNHPSWTGVLEGLRIDPPASRGEPIAITSVELLP